MKVRFTTNYGMYLFCIILCTACFQGTATQQDVAQKLFDKNPVTITWTKDTTDTIESSQQDVERYIHSNRSSEGPILTSKYRLTLKTIEGEIYTRLDFAADEHSRARTVVANTKEMVMYDSLTGEIEQRVLFETDTAPQLSFFNTQSANTRVSLVSVRAEAQRLSFDIFEESPRELILEIPSNLINKIEGETRIKTRAVFDTLNETLASVEIVNMLEDGTKVTTTTNQVYEQKNGESIKIGSVTFIESINPAIEQIENGEYFNSIDEVPEISSTELAQMQERGLVTENGPLIFGNPGDLSYQQTVVEVYSDIKINQVDNSAFRILLGGTYS